MSGNRNNRNARKPAVEAPQGNTPVLPQGGDVVNINADTVEFTTGETVETMVDPDKVNGPTEETHAQYNERDRSGTFDHLDAGTSVYADLLKRNELVSTSGEAIAAFKAWSGNDKHSIVFIARLVREAMEKFAMNKVPERANVAPMTHAVYAFEHRGKKNYASKLIAWVQAVSNYKWNEKTRAFKLREKKPVLTVLSPEQRAIFDAPFYTYVKPVKKTDWQFQAALKKLLAKAGREGIDTTAQKETLAEMIRLADLEKTNEAERTGKGEATIRNDLKPALNLPDTQANTEN